MSNPIDWSRSKTTAAGTPRVRLEDLATIAALKHPGVAQIRECLSPDQADPETTSRILASLLSGQAPPQPSDKNTMTAPNQSAPPNPSNPPNPPTAQQGLSLADQLKGLLGGSTSDPVINEADFETDDVFHQLFAESDANYNYVSPQWFTSPGAPTVRYETTGEESGAASDDPEVIAAQESVLISWKPLPDHPRERTLYRVISADREVDAAPGAGTELVITHGTAFRDERPASTGFRHYMVWAYTWNSVAEMTSMEPLFIGEDIAIFPPRNIRLAESGGTVNGTWEARQGHDEVCVYHALKGYPGKLNVPGNMLVDGLVERSGFSHRVDLRGLVYEYTVTPRVTFRDQLRSGDPTPAQQVLISAEIEQVELLSVEAQKEGDEDRIRLSWIAPPTGSVKIYLTDQHPDPELPMAQRDKMYLDDDDALGTTEWTTVEDGTSGEHLTKTMVWPRGWHRVYVTPVNIVGDRAWVGESSVLQKVENLTGPRLIERVTNQLITFDWPGGAEAIDVRTKQESVRYHRDSYDRQGGIRLNLLSTGDTVTLTPVAPYAGKDKTADIPTEIQYPGLRAYSYDVAAIPDGTMQLKVWSVGRPDANAPHFRLIHNPGRLPLFIGDGEPVSCAKVNPSSPEDSGTSIDLYQPGLPAGGTDAVGGMPIPGANAVSASIEDATWWIDHNKLHSGYLRLFIDDLELDSPSSTATSDTASYAPSDAYADNYGAHSAPVSGFNQHAFGGSLSAVAPEQSTAWGSSNNSSQFSPSTETTSTWIAANIPAIIIEGEVATRLSLGNQGGRI